MPKSHASQLAYVIEETTAEQLGNAIKLLIDAGYTIKIADDGYCYIIEYDSTAYGTPLQWVGEDQWVDEWIPEKGGKKDKLLRSDLEDTAYCEDHGIIFFDDPSSPTYSYVEDLPGFYTAYHRYHDADVSIEAMDNEELNEAVEEYEAQKPEPAVIDKDVDTTAFAPYTDIPYKLNDQVLDLFRQHIHNPGDGSISTSDTSSKTATTKKK